MFMRYVAIQGMSTTVLDDVRDSVPGRTWFRALRHASPSRPGLYLFPHGGGSAGSYRHWCRLLPAEFALSALQLPGRRDRITEPPFRDISLLMPELLRSFVRENDRELYAFFGHSFGAQLAYRLAVELGRADEGGPCLLGVSAWAPGGTRPRLWKELQGSDAQMVDAMRELGSLPVELGNPSALQAVLPALRADCAVSASYIDDHARVSCPVLAFSGLNDPVLIPGAMRRWACRTPRLLGERRLPGGHFYINRHAAAVADEVAHHLLAEAT